MFKNTTFQKLINHNLRSIRYKNKEAHWSVQLKKKTATGKALAHFDDFYKKVYGANWGWMRQALLADHKYVAVLNNYSDTDENALRLEHSGALNLRTLFDLEKGYIKERPVPVPIPVPVQEQPQNAKIPENTPIINSIEQAVKTAQIDQSRIISPGASSDVFSALYEFIPATKIKGKEDWIPETQHYRYYEDSSFKVKIEKQNEIHFPEYLNVYCYADQRTVFDTPKRGTTNVYNYYLLDGASVLPVLALGIKPRDRILDLCAAPGGKSLIALQTLYPDNLVCCDVELSRVKRIYNVLRQYLYDFDEKWLNPGKIRVIQEDGRNFSQFSGFDCVLVDVPCTNDRLSLQENDNNWFKASRTKERLQLPEIQAGILMNALKLVKVGGCVVYSTCSLSPIQNDGVVNMALKEIWEETNIEVTVMDLTEALEPTKCVFKYAEPSVMKFGHLVVPFLSQNYGPMYFCKLIRTK